MLADYHVHCEFSDDSFEPMENQIERGIALGLEEICFTDHVDYGIKKDWDEGNIIWRPGDPHTGVPDMPIANVDYPLYFDKLHRMQARYGDAITIKKGLEFGIQTHTVNQFEKLYIRYQKELDFVLLSMHQVHDLEFWTQDFQRGKSQAEYNREYYEEIYKVMQIYDHYSVLAHLDLIVRYDQMGVYPFANVQDIVTEILKFAILKGKGIELNTSSWRYGLKNTQPSRAILKLYKQLGGKIITIGSDAHNISQLGDHLQEGRNVLKECGFDEICTFEHMQPVFHPL